jgi:serine protease Do
MISRLFFLSALFCLFCTSCGISWFGEDVSESSKKEEDTIKETENEIAPIQEPKKSPLNKVIDAFVTIYTYDKNGKEMALGSGFFVKNNLIATNFHVIQGGVTFKFKGKSDSEKSYAEIYKIDKLHDIALLETSSYHKDSDLKIQSKYPEQGADIIVLGSPEGLEASLSDGIVGAIRKFAPYDFDLIQITAPISQGSSGGPVVNNNGEIIGISVASLRDAQNLNFAIPAKYLEFLMKE